MVLVIQRERKRANRKETRKAVWKADVMVHFRFEDMRLEDIMVTLNRWYDCTVSYSDDALRDLRFTGAAEKDRSASYLLELIEMITEVKFQVDGKHILITRK